MAVSKMFSRLIFVTLISLSVCNHHLLVDKLRKDFMELEDKLWKFVLWDAHTIDQEEVEFQIIKQFNVFDQTLKQMPEDILRGTEPIRHLGPYLFLYSEVGHTDNMYQKFRQFQEDQLRWYHSKDKKPRNPTIQIEDIIGDILNPKHGANAMVHAVYNLTFGHQNMILKIFDILVDDYYCKGYNQSPQQIYYNLYNVIALNGLKSYVMLQFAYLMKRTWEKGNYTDLSEITKVHFKERVNETMSVFRGAMELSPVSSVTLRCDPKDHKKEETYTEFTRLLQGHIENEVDLNNDGTCRKNCAAYPASESYGCYDSDSQYCKETQRCGGKLLNCRFIESHMDVCPSVNPSRRYDYIRYEHGLRMGKEHICGTKPINSWYRWFVHCSYCLCLCDEQGPKSDRYVNLRPVLADIVNNMVVTGLRFVKSYRIMHLQIQEGQLLPYGYIDNSTVHWVPVKTYQITDKGIYDKKDYFTMTYENRAMALDDVELNQENYIVTGVRFQFIEGKLRFQIHVNTFDWETGMVSQKNGNYVYKVGGGKNKIQINNVDIPIESPLSEMNYVKDSYVEFTHTGFELDVAQTTVPYVDAQPVFNKPAVPLKGAGIYYKGREGFGGFIAPKILSYDYSKLILETFPKPEERFDSRINVAPN